MQLPLRRLILSFCFVIIVDTASAGSLMARDIVREAVDPLAWRVLCRRVEDDHSPAGLEMTPLFTLTPNLLWNLGDPSSLLQVVTRYSLGDNLVQLSALSIPMGPSGTEYGGIESGEPSEFFPAI